MSYIRCLSNPECLYIWDEHGGKTAISIGADPVIYVNTRGFQAILSKWLKNHWWIDEEKGVRVGNLVLREEQIPFKREIALSWYWEHFLYLLRGSKNIKLDSTFTQRLQSLPRIWKMTRDGVHYKWVLRDRNKKICEMWTTTLFYIAQTNVHRWEKKKRK